MRLALATWNGRISPVFDVARQVLILEIEAGRAISQHEEDLPGTDLQLQVIRLEALGVQALICGALSQAMEQALASAGIRVMPFTAGAIEEVLAAWLGGSLPNPALRMPGCCGRMKESGGRGVARRSGRRRGF